MFPIPKALAYGLCGIEAILLVVFGIDAGIGIRNLLKKKAMLDVQIYSILLRINVFHVVATILAALLFVLGVVEIAMLSEEDRFGTLSGGRMFTQGMRIVFMFMVQVDGRDKNKNKVVRSRRYLQASTEEDQSLYNSVYNYKGMVLDIIKKYIKDNKEMQFCFDVISHGRMFSAEYKARTYHPIMFVEEMNDTTQNQGAIRVAKMSSSIFQDIDASLGISLNNQLQQAEDPDQRMSEIQLSQSGIDHLTTSCAPILDSFETADYNAFLLDKATNYNPLYYTLKLFYYKYDWKHEFKMNDAKFSNFSYAL